MSRLLRNALKGASKVFNPFVLGGGGLFFNPLLKISLVNPYLKILDLTQLFIADATMKKKSKIWFTPLRALAERGKKIL